jgi:hypothetical protein
MNGVAHERLGLASLLTVQSTLFALGLYAMAAYPCRLRA